MNSFVKLVVHFVNVATNSCCVHSQRLQVVVQDLHGSNGVDGGQTHNNLVHEGSILHLIEGVLVPVGKKSCLCICHQ